MKRIPIESRLWFDPFSLGFGLQQFNPGPSKNVMSAARVFAWFKLITNESGCIESPRDRSSDRR
jgi:hypothetical protein